MEHTQHLMVHLSQFQPEFQEMAARLREASSWAMTQGPGHPTQVFARAWNASLADRSLENEGYRRILQRTYCWIQGLLNQSHDYRKEILDFASQCRSDLRLRQASLYQDTPQLAEERLLRAVGGVAQAIRARMPESVRWERRGRLDVQWEQTGPWLDGRAFWQATDVKDAVRLLAATQSSLRLYSELPAAESELFADHLLRAVRDNRVTLPDFRLKEQENQHSVFEWAPEGVRPVSENEAPGVGNRMRELEDLMPFPIELDLWEHHPEAAEAVDEALLKAVVEDERTRQARRGGWERNGSPKETSAVEQVVRALQELTGRPSEDIVLLLTPRLEKRVQQECEEETCAAYRHALEFFASRLSPR